MVGSVLLFALCIIIYILISDVITVFFRLTGMTKEKAQFQAISLLTNSGYTTTESETVVMSKNRRQLALITMLFGYAFSVTIVSALVNMFMNMSNSEISSLLYLVPGVTAGLAAFYLLRRSAFFRTWFDGLIERLGKRVMFGKNKNKVILVEDYGNLVLAHIYLQTVPPILQGKTLAQADLARKYQVNILMVKGLTTEAVQATAATVLRPHDIIMVMGRQKDIRTLFEKTGTAAPAEQIQAEP